MNTELTFLMELFLEDEMPKQFREKIKDRIREVESAFRERPLYEPSFNGIRANASHSPNGTVAIAGQAPSMQRIMERNPDLIPQPAVGQPPQPVTPAAAQALAQRMALMQNALNEKPEAGRKSPRKL